MHPRTAHGRSVLRPAFTLVELMLVLAIIGVIASMSWPVLKRTFELARLKSAAEQVQAAFGHARVDAMNKGLPQVFHFEPGTGRYSVEVWQDDLASTEGDVATSNVSSTMINSGAPAGATTGAANTGAADTGAATHELPETIVFSQNAEVQDVRAEALASEGETPPPSAGGASSPPILFYPDGTASEASVTVTSPSGRNITISLRGFTGVSRLSEVFTSEAPPGAPGGVP